MIVKKLKLNSVRNAFIIGATCASMSVFAEEATVWKDSAGDVTNDGAGNCLHTIWWKKGTPCEGEVSDTHKHGSMQHTHEGGSKPHEHKKAEVKPKPKAAPAPVAKPAPKFEPFRLSSAAAFELSGSNLSDEGKAEIKSFAAKLKGHKVNKITVEGFTDSTGAAAFNQALSERRANAVKDEIIKNGIDASLITAIGRGESNPIADNATRQGRAANRRVKVSVDATRQVQ